MESRRDATARNPARECRDGKTRINRESVGRHRAHVDAAFEYWFLEFVPSLAGLIFTAR